MTARRRRFVPFLALVLALVAVPVAAARAASPPPATPDPTIPILVEVHASGSATFDGSVSINPGCGIIVTFSHSLVMNWTARYRTRLKPDGTVVAQPGYVSPMLGSQTFTPNVAGSGGEDCGQQLALTQAQSMPCSPTLALAPLEESKIASDPLGTHAQGPTVFDVSAVASCSALSGGLAGNDLGMLQGSMPDLFTADLKIDPAKVQAGTQTIPISLRSGLPVDGATCTVGAAAELMTCSKSVSWSGVALVSTRPDDGSDGSTQAVPPAGSLGPAITGFTPPSGTGASIQNALRDALQTRMRAGTAALIMGRFYGRSTGRAIAAPVLLAQGVARTTKAGPVVIRLRMTAAGRRLLAAYRGARFTGALQVTATGSNGKRRVLTKPLVLHR